MAAPRLVRVVEREARVYRRLWRGSVFSSFVGPVLFLTAIGLGLGGLVDEGTGRVEGMSYLVFVTPGLLAAGVMQSAAAESLWPVLGGTKWLRTFHGMVASPLRPSDVAGGYICWLGVRAALAATVFVVVASALGGVASPWAVLAVPAAVLTALAFAAPLTAFSASRDSDVSFSLVMRLLVQPLFLFSGTFFPVSQLPEGLQPVAWLSPLYHGVELCRAATTGTGSPAAIATHVAVLVGVVALGWWAAARTFARRLSP